jgi:hypothetical protein
VVWYEIRCRAADRAVSAQQHDSDWTGTGAAGMPARTAAGTKQQVIERMVADRLTQDRRAGRQSDGHTGTRAGTHVAALAGDR